MKRTMLGAALAMGLATMLGTVSAAHAQAYDMSKIPNLAGKILTVTGPIDPQDLGPTMMHEHIFIHFRSPATAAGEWDQMTPDQRELSKKLMAKVPKGWADKGIDPTWAKGFKPGWNTLDDFDTQLAEVKEFKKAGGGTIVDVSNFGLSRNPEFLKRISEASGLHVVMGAGWYQKMFHAPDMGVRTVEQLTDIIVHDITVGAQNTGIRSGIIGEIGIEGRPMTENEFKSVRASARASRITGAPMTFHVGGGTAAEKQMVLDIVEQEGVDLHHVVMGHNFSGDVAQMKALTDRGAYVELDGIAWGPKSLKPDAVQEIAKNVVSLVNAGLTDYILFAQDICTQPQLKKNGGGGYAYISNYVIPELKKMRVSDATIHRIMVENPQRALTFVAPQAPLVGASHDKI